MRTHPRSVWLALAAGALLVTLSVSSAFGADPPDGDQNHGQQVADFVHDLLFGDQDSNDEDTPEDEDTPDDEEATDEEEPADEESTDEESADGPPDNHGQCVRVVAMGTDTGGPNGNHGGTVSEAARVTCWEDGDDSESEGFVEDESDSARGNSANAHEMGRGHGNGHGHGGNH